MASLADEFADAPYVSLATYRKSGAEVRTPVWCAAQSDALFVFSAGHAGKVKRLRNDARVKLARCDVRGKVLGDWVAAQGQLVDEPDVIDTALGALHRKYGWQMWLADWGAKLSGKFNKRAYIRITCPTETADAQSPVEDPQ